MSKSEIMSEILQLLQQWDELVDEAAYRADKCPDIDS